MTAANAQAKGKTVKTDQQMRDVIESLAGAERDIRRMAEAIEREVESGCDTAYRTKHVTAAQKRAGRIQARICELAATVRQVAQQMKVAPRDTQPGTEAGS